jgi:hypothetical protein
MLRKSMLAGAAALAIMSTAAIAAVAFDPATGTGFVGKGDIQVLYGWNNKQLQDNASGVRFAYDAVDTYDVECYWETTTGGPRPNVIVHDITIPRHTSVSATVAYEARKNSQGKDGSITGFNLTGLGTTVYGGTVPQVGGACPGQSDLATIIAVTPTGSSGGLTVTYGGTTYPLPNTPVI